MTAEIEPQSLFLTGQQFFRAPFAHAAGVVDVERRDFVDRLGGETKEIRLAGNRCFLVLVGDLQDLIERRHQHRACMAKTVKGAGLDQGFQCPAVDALVGITPTDVDQVAVRPVAVALFDQGIDDRFADTLERAQPVANGVGISHAEAEAAAVDVGRYHRQTQCTAFFDEAHDLVGGIHVSRHDGRHKRRRVVGLEPGRLIGDQRIGHRMGLVKTVAGELFHQVKNISGIGLGNAIGLRTTDENLTLLGHLFRLFLAHRAPQEIGGAQRITGQHACDLHDLFLIQNHAIGRFQNRFKGWHRVFERLASVFTFNEVVDHTGLQGPRSEQGHQGNHVFEQIRLEPLDQFFHAARFELEHRRSACVLHQLEGRGVVERNLFDRDWLLLGRDSTSIDVTHRPIDDGQSAQTKEVELHQADSFNIVHVELRDQRIATLFTIQRHKVRQRGGRDDQTTGVLAGVTRQSFELPRERHDGAHVLLLVLTPFERRLLAQRAIEGHLRIEGNEFGELVDETIGETQHATDVAHHRFGRHGAVGDDLCHLVTTVARGHVFYDFIAAVHAEVDVEIGHRHALGIEETLEQKIVFERVEFGNAERKSRQ